MALPLVKLGNDEEVVMAMLKAKVVEVLAAISEGLTRVVIVASVSVESPLPPPWEGSRSLATIVRQRLHTIPCSCKRTSL